MTPYTPVTLRQKFTLLHEQWQPRIVAEMNDYQFKIVRIAGDFVWHTHDNTDEAFLVIDGCLRIDFRDGSVTLNAGDMFVVPKGKEHKTFAATESKILMIEPRDTPNTGDNTPSERTAQNDLWI